MGNVSEMSNTRTQGAGLYNVLGFLSAIVSLVYFPLFFGVFGAVMGILSLKKGSRTGRTVIIASILLGAIGLFASGIIMTRLRLMLGM